MTLINKNQIVEALSKHLQVSVKEKHLKIVAFADVEEWDGETHKLREHIVVRDRPKVGVEFFHVLVFRDGGIDVTESEIHSTSRAFALFANAVTERGLTVLRHETPAQS